MVSHQDDDPKHPASSVKEFIRAKKWKVLDCPDLNPIEHEFHQLKRRVKAENPQNKQQLELAALKAGKESGDVYHRFTAVLVHKGSATK